MSTWIVGDLQGCASSFEHLLQTIGFEPGRDTVYLVGDIINRGPRSLDALRMVKRHDGAMRSVMGNHEVHLLWCALGSGNPGGRDTLREILNADDCAALIDFVSELPLLMRFDQSVICHAGLHPRWSLDDAVRYAESCEAALRARDGAWLDHYRAKSPRDEDERRDYEHLDLFTRMRALRRSDLAPNFRYNGRYEELPADLLAWFDAPTPHRRPERVYFGHWAALGHHRADPYIALDTGCVWGNELSAWCHETNELVSIPAQEAQDE